MSTVAQRAAQPARFLVVGGAGYGVNLLTFAVLVGAGMKYVAASIVSYLVSNALMYLGNRYFTFRLGNDGFWSAYGRYLLVGTRRGHAERGRARAARRRRRPR